jgi:hypothetical protein
MFTIACIVFGSGNFPSLEIIKPNIILENVKCFNIISMPFQNMFQCHFNIISMIVLKH